MELLGVSISPLMYLAEIKPEQIYLLLLVTCQTVGNFSLSITLPLFIVIVLQKGLKENFADAQVSVVDCPDLTQEPFNFPAKGNLAFLSFTKTSPVLST